MNEQNGFDKAWGIAQKIDGWLSEGQAMELYKAARSVGRGTAIVEIGSHHGRSAVVLASAARPGVEVVAVDPYDDERWGGGVNSFEILQANLQRAGVTNRVRVVRDTSEAAAKRWTQGPIGFVFIDGAHDRRSVLNDIDGWTCMLTDGGMVFLHDAFSSVGVTTAILQRFLSARNFAYMGAEQSLAMFRRCSPSIGVAGSTSARLLIQLPYFVRNLAVKVAVRRGWQRLSRLLGHSGDELPY